jgi:hypothetical protein
MNIRPGIKLLQEIVGYGDPISKGDRFEAVYKYFHNKGDPIIFETHLQKAIPKIVDVDGKYVIAWDAPEIVRSNVSYEYNGWLERQSDLLPGIYYSLLGMRKSGFRSVRIAPHFFSHSLKGGIGVKA